MLSFEEYILHSDDPLKTTFNAFHRSYCEYVRNQCKKSKTRPPHMSMQSHLNVYNRVIDKLNEEEKCNKAQRTAIAISTKVTDAVSTMINSSVEYVTATHLETLKRAKESSDDDFEKPPSYPTKKKNKQGSQSTVDLWTNLERASTSLHNGDRNIRIPKVPPNLPPNHARLFQVARSCLVEANGPQKKPTDIVFLKDALVAMSCILNLRSPSTTAYFPPSFIAEATDGCYEDEFDQNELVSRCFAGLAELCRAKGVLSLRDAVEDRKAEYRKKRQTGQLSVRSREEKLFDIVEIACDLVLEKPFVEPLTEADSVHTWLKIFEKLLPERLKMKTGETVLSCTKPGQEQKDEDMNGRKVDLKFLFEGIEVAVIEFKSPSQTKGAVAKQSRKSLRLGKSVLQHLDELGVEDASVICGDVSGLMGSFTKIMRFDDIFVAGKITETVVTLPKTKQALVKFLDGRSISVLLNFAEYIDDLGARAVDARESAAVLDDEEKFELQMEYRKATAHKENRTFQNTIKFSPTSKRISNALPG
ncbi:hypothetical protein BGX33_000657 [Mortierella sp. NVP41]|nr:hypothetical protein BGX33_000657 [Mortierella sp. NVP41]